MKTMRAIRLHSYNPNLIRTLLSLKVEEIPKPSPGADEVLVKIEASPCNPSDIAFMRGMYNIKKDLPKVLGFEGCGIVQQTGTTLKSKALEGKRVSFSCQEDTDGPWAEYIVVKADICLEIKPEMQIDQAACFYINPFTAYGLLELAIKNKAEALIQNAAAGQIGVFLHKMAKLQGINTINIVRKEEHIAKLKNQGMEYVLNMNSESFSDDLKKHTADLNATIAFDAVGGEITGQIFNAMPKKSTLYLYGGLSGKPISGFETLDFIFKQKSISGFNLNDWFDSKSKEAINQVSDNLQEMILQGTIHTSVQASFLLENAIEGLKQYIANMSEGKILFKP